MPIVQIPSTIGTGTSLTSGSGSPEGIVTAGVGSLFIQVDGARGQTLWRKYSGTGSAGWSLLDDFVLNVLDFGAKGDGVTDDTAAIQAAIDAANALAYGVVYIPAKDANNGYIFTQLKYYRGTRIVGDGFGGAFSGSRGTWLYQKSGTALEMVVPNDATQASFNVFMQDVTFSAFQNQTANTGGVRLENCNEAKLVRVGVTYTKNYGFHIKSAVDAAGMYNTFISCRVGNTDSAAKAFLLTSTAAFSPDAVTLIDCLVTVGTSTYISVDGSAGRGADSLTVIGSHFISNGNTVALEGACTGAKFIGNRFETVSGNMSVTLTPTGAATTPNNFVSNSWSAPGTFTWTNNNTSRPSTRISEQAGTGPITEIGALDLVITTITYSASMLPNAEFGINRITATNGTAFTINNPTNRRMGRTFVLDIKNSSGGALGAVTFNAAFLLAGAFVAPANTKRRLYEFYDDGTNLVETYRSAADI